MERLDVTRLVGEGGQGVWEWLNMTHPFKQRRHCLQSPVSTSSLHRVFLLLAERQRNIFDLVTAHLKGILGNLNASFTVHYLQNFVEGTKTRRRSRIDGLPLPDVFLLLHLVDAESSSSRKCKCGFVFAEFRLCRTPNNSKYPKFYIYLILSH